MKNMVEKGENTCLKGAFGLIFSRTCDLSWRTLGQDTLEPKPIYDDFVKDCTYLQVNNWKNTKLL